MTAPIKALTEPLLAFEDQESARLSELDPAHPLVGAIRSIAATVLPDDVATTVETAAAQVQADLAASAAQASISAALTVQTQNMQAQATSALTQAAATLATANADEAAAAASAAAAAGSAGAASGSAAAALASQNSAAASAATAGTQASNSSASATAAAASAASLAGALATFNAQWLGPHASDPTLDNSGHPLQEGAEYENTSSTPAQIRVYHNGAWQDQDQTAETASSNATLAATQSAASAGASLASQTAAAASAADAQNWATQMGALVDGVDFSAKQYASNAAAQATAAAISAAAANVTMNGELTLDVSAADVTLTVAQAANAIYKFTGQLAGNRIVTVPAASHTAVVYNATTNPTGQSYTLTVVAQGQAPSVQVLHGKANSLFSDATGVYVTSANAGVGYSGIYPLIDNTTLDVTYIGALVEQTVAGKTTTLPKASTYPAGLGVTVKSLVTSTLALQGADTCDDLTMPYAMLASDITFLVSDGVSKWSVGWFTNKNSPVFGGMVTSKSGGYTFPDGSTQTTAQGLTQATSVRYTVGATDTTGSFAAGDTRLRTAGFVSPFVTVFRNSGRAYPGVHYNLDADGVHINWLDGSFIQDDDIFVETRFPYNPSTVYVPGVQGLTPAVNATFVAFPHVAGCAWLLNIGSFLRPGVDYTDDNTGFYLQGWAVDSTTELSVINFNPVSIANVLATVNPIITSGVLQFADGSQQNTAALSNRNYVVDGNLDSWTNISPVTMSANSQGYSTATMFYCSTGGGSGQTQVSQLDISSLNVAGLTTPYRYAHRSLQTVAATGSAPFIAQKVEGARTLAGRSATFSVVLWSNTGSNISLTSVISQQQFGTGGSPSASVLADKAVTWTVTPTPKKFSVRLDIPSIAGKTFGTSGNDYYLIGLWLPLGVTFDLISTQWQLEASSPTSSSDLTGNGGSPTPFEYRGQQVEAARVQRYYETGAEPYRYFGPMPSGGGSAYDTAPFTVAKRAVPAVSVGTAWQYYNAGTNAAFTPTLFGTISQLQFNGTGLTNWNGWTGSGTWVADARL